MNRSTLIISRSAAIRRLASTRSSAPKNAEPKFSQSAAFQGRKPGTSGSQQPLTFRPFQFDYYSSDEFANKKVFSALGSLAVLVLYFGFLREPSDLDEIWNAPPHILTANLERKMLRDQIEEARAKGQSTALLEAQLEYVDVKEAALKVQFSEKK